MPFTIAHAAAVLPLHAWSRRLPLAALMIGSMSPDFLYFLPVAPTRVTAHSLWGLAWFCLPAGLAVWWVFVRLLERPTLALIPGPWRAGLPPPTNRISFSLVARAGIAVVLGAVTHLAWDSFTHASTPVVRAIPALRDVIVSIGSVHMRLLDFLQVASSVFGLAVLGIWALRLRRAGAASAPAPARTLPEVTTRTRVAAVAAIVLGTCALALIYYAWNSGLRIEGRLFYLAIGGMTGCALAWCGVAAWLQARWGAAH